MDRDDQRKRVRVDTGPLGMGRADEGGTRAGKLWPWYAGGSVVLGAAIVVATLDFGSGSPAVAGSSSSANVATTSAPSHDGHPLAPARQGLASAPQAVASPPVAEPATTAPGAASAPTARESTPVEVHDPDPTLAKSLNNLGYNFRKDGDHAAARTLYREATLVDPTHVWSRYNLACELALAGENDEALELLGDIARIGGPDADEALFGHAPKDKDFARLKSHPRFKALTTR